MRTTWRIAGLVLLVLAVGSASAYEKCPNCGLGEGHDTCGEIVVKAAKVAKPAYFASPDAINHALKYKQAAGATNAAYGPAGASGYGPAGASGYGPAGASGHGPAGASGYGPAGASGYGPAGVAGYGPAGAMGYGAAPGGTGYGSNSVQKGKGVVNALEQPSPYGGDGGKTYEELQHLLYMKPGVPVAPKFEPIGDLCSSSKSKPYPGNPYGKHKSGPNIVGVTPAYPGKSNCKCPGPAPPKAYPPLHPAIYGPSPAAAAYPAASSSAYGAAPSGYGAAPAMYAPGYPASAPAPYAPASYSAPAAPAPYAPAPYAPTKSAYATSLAVPPSYSPKSHAGQPSTSSYLVPKPQHGASAAPSPYSPAKQYAPGYPAPATASYPPSSYGASMPSASAYPAAPSSYGAPPAAGYPGSAYDASSAYAAAPAPSTYGSAPAPSAYGSPPAPSAYGSAPAPSAYGSAPAPSAYGAAPAPSGYGAASAYPAPKAYGKAAAPSGPQYVPHDDDDEGLSFAEQEQLYRNQPTIPADPVSISLAYKNLLQVPSAKKYVPEDRLAFGHRQQPADGQVHHEIADVPEEKLLTVDKPIVELKTPSKSSSSSGYSNGYGESDSYADLEALEREKMEQDAEEASERARSAYVSYSDLGYAPVSPSNNHFITQTHGSANAVALASASYPPPSSGYTDPENCGPVGPTVPGYKSGSIIIEDKSKGKYGDGDDEDDVYGGYSSGKGRHRHDSYESDESASGEEVSCGCSKGGIIERIKSGFKRKHSKY